MPAILCKISMKFPAWIYVPKNFPLVFLQSNDLWLHLCKQGELMNQPIKLVPAVDQLGETAEQDILSATCGTLENICSSLQQSEFLFECL